MHQENLNTDCEQVKFAKKYKGTISGSRYLLFRDLPQLIRTHVKGTLTLDYGCGPGESTRFLKSLGRTVEGMDINKHVIETAKEKDPGGVYTVIKSANVPKNDQYYDLVSAIGVLVNISTKRELLKISKEMYRVLKYGGTFIATANNEHTFKNEWLSASVDFEENKKLASGSPAKFYSKIDDMLFNLYYWTEDDYYEIFNKAGFEVVQVLKPLGKVTDDWQWLSETEKPITSIYVAKKEYS